MKNKNIRIPMPLRYVINTALILALWAVLSTLIGNGTITRYWTGILIMVGINIILATSLNIATGYLGQLPLGHAGFMAVGAYTSAIFMRAVNRFPEVFAEADGIIISGREHLLKPYPEIYQLLLSRYDLKAEECVFIDDREDNVEGARKVGMEGIVFTSVNDLL